MTNLAIHESATSDKVIKFIELSSLKREFQDLINNTMYLKGAYYLDNEIVIETIFNDIHTNIIKD